MASVDEILANITDEEVAAAEQDVLASISDEEIAQAEQEAQAQQANPLVVGAQAALGSATLGLSDLAIVEGKAALRAREQAISEGLSPGSPKFGPNPEFESRVSELRKQFSEEEREKLRLEREASPVASTVGEIGGFISPVGPAAGAFRLGAKGAQAAAKGLGLTGKIASGAAAGAGGTAAFETAREAVQPEDTGLTPTGS